MPQAPTSPPDPSTDPAPPDVHALEHELATLRDTLAQAREALDHAERRHLIEIELLRADAVDLETARLLAVAAVENAPTTDIPKVVASLRERKPFLFRRIHPPSAMARAVIPTTPADQAAADARATGDRRALLRYLKARRAT